jgi:hypothetical protein
METESGPPWTTKIAVVLREGLLPWQELNVGKDPVPLTPRKLGASLWTGPPDGTAYLAMFRQPVLVLSGDGAVLKQARARALCSAGCRWPCSPPTCSPPAVTTRTAPPSPP